jgi:transposase
MRYEQYIGVDLHKAFFQACAVTPEGTRCWEDRFPRTVDGLAAFRGRCQPGTAVAIEASTPTWHFADAIRSAVAAVIVVDPFKTKIKAGYAAKTDRLDAQRLADALRRESVTAVYYPPPAIRDLRELCRYRHALVRTRTLLTQRLRAVLLRQGLVDAPAAGRRLVSETWLTTLTLPTHATASVVGLHRLLRHTDQQIREIDQVVDREAARDPVVQALVLIRGIGPTLGLLIRAELGTIDRFPTPAHVASYAGVVPRVHATGGHVRYGAITKRGSPWLRWALIEAAIHGPTRRDAIGRWGRRLAVRKGALKARVAMARALCTEIFVRWPKT